MDPRLQLILNRVIDTAVAVGLVAVLALIYGRDRISVEERAVESARQVKVEVREVAKPQEAPKPLTMAVTTPQYDDMGTLLRTMGSGYGTFDEISLENLSDAGRLKNKDIVFLTCRNNAPVQANVKQALREYVSKGGTLYASDLWYPLIADTFPEFASTDPLVPGKKQTLKAEVVDPGLRDVLGSALQLNFEVDDWLPATFAGNQLKIILKGRYTTMTGAEREVPLLVKFPLGQGTVIFTAFHNAKQNDEEERKLLRYLVFMAATAKEEAKVTETIASGGFSPTRQNILTASSDNSAVTQTYRSTKGGRLKFALGFANRGAASSPHHHRTGRQEGRKGGYRDLLLRIRRCPDRRMELYGDSPGGPLRRLSLHLEDCRISSISS